LTADERTLFDYVSALCDWLGLYHDHSLPQPEAVLAEVNRQLETLHGNITKGSPKANESLSPPTNGQKRHAEEPPAVRDPPEGVPEFFNSMAARFKEVSGEVRLPWEALHISTLTQEVRSAIVSVSATEVFVFFHYYLGCADVRASVSAIQGTGRREGEQVRLGACLLCLNSRGHL
ncbi:hypothetical protein DFH11DRAFT_1509285, partial [Phellopilus nigrolimitatus]